MRSKIELLTLLRDSLNQHKHDRKVVESLKSEMLKGGILRGETQRIISGDIALKDIEERTLILLTLYAHRAMGEFNLNPYGYFSTKDIESALSQKVEKVDESIHFPITFSNAIMKNEKTFTIFEDIKNIVKLYNSNLFAYNYNINKQYKLVKNIENKMVKQLDINTKRVKEIAELIVANKYTFTVLLNVLKGSGKNSKEIEFNNNKLTIHDSEFDIIYGLHDISAMAHVIEENPDFEATIQIEIMNCELDDITNIFNNLKLKGGVN